jgi:hypothetical protein
MRHVNLAPDLRDDKKEVNWNISSSIPGAESKLWDLKIVWEGKAYGRSHSGPFLLKYLVVWHRISHKVSFGLDQQFVCQPLVDVVV